MAKTTMKQPRWMAWYGTLQISPHPRLRYEAMIGRSDEGCASAMGDKRRWDKKNPDKPAEVRAY